MLKILLIIGVLFLIVGFCFSMKLVLLFATGILKGIATIIREIFRLI